MPGRTLATWYGLGGGGEASGNNAYPEHPPYSRHHAASSPFDQGHYGAPAAGGYGYYNQGGSTPSYSGPDSRPYPAQSPSYQQHYSPAPSPAPYHYVTDQQQGPSASASQQQQQPSHMSFSSQQSPAQGAYTPTPSVPAPSHYAPNHRHAGQHGYPAPAASQHQQWGNYGSSASPVMGSPSGQQQQQQQRSSNSQSPMSSQFPPQSPAQQQQQQPPSSHWQSHGHGMHTNSNHNMVANMSPPPPSPLQSQAAAAAQYYQASPSTAQVACPPSSIPPRSTSGRTQAASPQQLDLSCPSPRQPVDLHSPGPTMASAGSWPARSTGGEGGSSPLASLQMLVNQDMNRQAAAAAAYPPNSQGMVDLSLPRGNTPHQKPEELRNGAASTTSSPPALNGDLSSSADSGISSPHLHPPDKPTGPRISVKSPQRLAAEADRRAQQRTTPSPQSPMVKPAESQSEPEGSPSPMPREARTKASMKRARKVDAILENLSGTKKKRPSSPPTPEAPPVVNIVPPSEDSGMEGSTSCPNSPNKAPRSEREDTVSPNFDDASQDNSKPRRKRKPDNPVRLKTTEEGKNSKGEPNKSEPETNKAPTPVAVEAPPTEPPPKEVPPPPEPPKSDAVDLTVKPAAVSQTPEAKLDATISAVSSVVETPPSEPPSDRTPTPPPPAPPADPPTSNKSDIAQVETELAKMFEGIESEPLRPRASSLDETIDAVAKAGNDNNEPQPSTSAASSPSKSSPSKTGKRGRPKLNPDSSSEASPKKQKKNKDETPKKKRPKSKLSDEDDLFTPEALHKKKKKKLDGKSPKVEEVKKKEASGSQAVNVERPRGPYVRIEGPKDSPVHVSVYNSTRGEDEDGERPSAACALKYNRKKLSWQNENDLRQRVQGLGFSSTMASHYDAFKLDESWRCAFCKRGSHSDGMGDLFGPYFIQQEADVLAMQQAEDAKKNKTKKKRRKSTEDPQKTSKKSKASGSGAQANPVPGTWEVWVHEPCAVWAAGVHLVGPRMVGLQEAIWGATTSACEDCGQVGANLGCVRRICDKRVHYCCARNLGWQLDEEGYISCCPAHKRGVTSSPSKQAST